MHPKKCRRNLQVSQKRRVQSLVPDGSLWTGLLSGRDGPPHPRADAGAVVAGRGEAHFASRGDDVRQAYRQEYLWTKAYDRWAPVNFDPGALGDHAEVVTVSEPTDVDSIKELAATPGDRAMYFHWPAERVRR